MASAVTVSPKGEAMSHGNRLGRKSFDAVALEAEIKRIGSLKIDDLRPLWETTFGKKVPLVLTKDLMTRMLAWHVQEQAFGGFDRATLKILEGYAHGRPAEPERFRRLKPGAELVREYQGERHTVTVALDGFVWRGATYGSLTTIARTITGSNWNGPRFFGLREKSGDAATVSETGRQGTMKRSPRAAR